VFLFIVIFFFILNKWCSDFLVICCRDMWELTTEKKEVNRLNTWLERVH